MVTEATKIKNGRILLPSVARKDWKNAEVFVRVSEETIVIKKIKESPFWETWGKMRKAGKKIGQKDVENAIVWARKPRR